MSNFDEPFQRWFDYYHNQPKVLKQLKKIAENYPKNNEDFFNLPFYNERGFSFFSGIGYYYLCEATIALIAQAFLSLIRHEANLKILLAFNGDQNLVFLLDEIQKVLATREFQVFRFEDEEVIPSVVSETFLNVELDACIYITYNDRQKKYKLTIYDSQGQILPSEIYANISEEMQRINIAAIKKVSRAPTILKKEAIYEQYKIRNLVLSKRTNDQKNLNIYINNSSRPFQSLATKILGALDYPYVVKNEKLPFLRNFYNPTLKDLKSAYKSQADISYNTDSAITFLRVGIHTNKSFNYLDNHEMVLFFSEYYLLAKKIANELQEDSYILMPEYLIFLTEGLLKKYQIVAYAIETTDLKELKLKKRLFAINRDHIFNLDYQIPYYSVAHFFIVFTELINYQKAQRGDLYEIFTQTKNLYPVINKASLEFRIANEVIDKLIDELYFAIQKMAGISDLIRKENKDYLLMVTKNKDHLFKFQYQPFLEKLYCELFYIGDDLTHKHYMKTNNQISNFIVQYLNTKSKK